MAQLGRFQHGGDIYGEGPQASAIDFSSNINPLGMPESVAAAIAGSAAACTSYPDPSCRQLKEAIAQVRGVLPQQVVCTAGASELIQRICLAFRPRRALVTAPCFSGYEQALELVGAQIKRHALREADGFALTESILQEDLLQPSGHGACEQGAWEVSDRPNLLFLCNPNNPTGLLLDAGLLQRILQAALAAGVVVFLDECFLAFADAPSAVPWCNRFPNLVVADAFTKLYAMPGVRLGYGICANSRIVRRLEAAGMPWSVSVVAQRAGCAALQVPGWVQESRAQVAAARSKLQDGLCQLGFDVVPGQANFLLFRSTVPLYGPLLDRGFLVRPCGNYEGLDDGWYRVAVKDPRQNEALLQALQQVKEGA